MIKHFLTFCKITVHLASLVPNKVIVLKITYNMIIVAKFVLNVMLA